MKEKYSIYYGTDIHVKDKSFGVDKLVQFQVPLLPT